MYLWTSVIFLLLVLAYEICNMVLIVRNRNWVPDTNDKEILFAHQYVGTKTSIRMWYIVCSLVKIIVATMPMICAVTKYQIQICGFIVPNALLLISCGAIIIAIETLYDSYETRIYQEGLRMAWLAKKEGDANGEKR